MELVNETHCLGDSGRNHEIDEEELEDIDTRGTEIRVGRQAHREHRR